MAEINLTTPPSREEPDAKEPKTMSTISEDDDELDAGKPKYERRKIAILFAYCGVGYQGMQKNPGAKTIEGELEEALYQSGAVPEPERANPKSYDWARSARTDKGVSAVGQVVSGRFFIEPPGLVDRLNSNLPGQIRIFGYRQATASFNAKKFCDGRRYVYLIPVFALDSSSHRDREAVIASLGSGEEFVKCLDCSERGRKVVGVMGKLIPKGKSKMVKSGISSNRLESMGKSEIGDETVCVNDNHHGNYANSEILVDRRDSAKTLDVVDMNSDSKMEKNKEKSVLAVGSAQNEASGFDLNLNSSKDSALWIDQKKINGEDRAVKKSEFCYSEKVKERFNRILNHYVGSHNFHNFTTRIKPNDPAACRCILSFHADTTVNLDGIEFIKCEVLGRSFMLHQIRKMMGLAVAIMRNSAPEFLIDTAFQEGVTINVPMAPEVGLYLDECFFTSYNNKWKDHEELSMNAYEKEAEEFKIKHIYSHIASVEHNEGAVALWLHSLNHRNYPDLRVVNSGDNAATSF